MSAVRFHGTRPNLRVGLAVAVLAVAIATATIYPLAQIAPVVSLSVVYLPAVLVVSAYWGFALGLLTSLLSATAFNFFHIPPVGHFTIADDRNWVALAAFTIVALVVSTIAELARNRTLEAQRRGREADLAATLARELLGCSATADALRAASRRVAEALAISSSTIELGTVQGNDRHRALALRERNGEEIATLLVPHGLPRETSDRLRNQIVPALEALVAIALRRDALQAEAVETAALRRSDDVKTALLRAVSHDLRTPLTAIVAGGQALGADTLSAEDRTELSAAVVDEGKRLASLVDKLLDLSKLQSGQATPRRDWVSLEDVVTAARDGWANSAGEVRVIVDPDMPSVLADAAQLERAFANLLENARRYSGGAPISVHVLRSGSNALVRVVDQGPGIEPVERDRIFEPFYRGQRAAGESWTGSGLGLAIVKGFVEANGGTIVVESPSGQGTSFVVSLPLAEVSPSRVHA